MALIEIERHESPYGNNKQQFPVLAPPPCGGGCSCCCCCSSSSFILPEAIILSAKVNNQDSPLSSRRKLFLTWLLIYGLGLVFMIILTVLLANSNINLELGLAFLIIGAVGAVVIDPIILGVLSKKVKEHDPDKRSKPIALYAFLIGVVTVAAFFGLVILLLI